MVQRELALPEEKVNIYGGGISLGHAIGATGARLLTSLSYQLNQKEKKYGVASLCIGGGLGLAMLLETSAKNSRFYQMSPEERLASLLNEGQISADTKKNLKIRLYLRRLPII